MSSITSTEHVLTRAGCALHYWLSGPADRPLVVLTHGATMDHRMFDAQVAALAREYRVLTWDVRGHGRSQPLGDGFSIRGAATDLVAILDQIGAPAAMLVGQSMGGSIAQELVFCAPQRVRGLVLIGCACNTLRLSAVEELGVRLSGPLLGLYPATTLRREIAQRTAVTPAVRAYAYEAAGYLSKHTFLLVWAALTRALHYEPGYRITQPLLLCYGVHDGLGNFKRAYPAWAARDGARLVPIPAAGHNANQDNPTFFNALLLEFLREHTAPQTSYEQDRLPRPARG